MYIHLVYYSGDRSLIENVKTNPASGITGDKTLFLDAVDNDGDTIRFQHNNGSHFDVIFLQEEQAQEVYGDILSAIREGENLLETDIREKQVT